MTRGATSEHLVKDGIDLIDSEIRIDLNVMHESPHMIIRDLPR